LWSEWGVCGWSGCGKTPYGKNSKKQNLAYVDVVTRRVVYSYACYYAEMSALAPIQISQQQTSAQHIEPRNHSAALLLPHLLLLLDSIGQRVRASISQLLYKTCQNIHLLLI